MLDFFNKEILPLIGELPQPKCEYCEDTLLTEDENGDEIPCVCTLSFEGDDDPRDTNNWELD